MPNTAEASSHFHYDGWVKPSFTVARKEEGELLALAKEGTRTYIDGGRRVGKTTLAINTLEKAGIKVLRINLEGIATLPKLIERVASDTDRFLKLYPAVHKALTGKEKIKAGVSGQAPLGILKFALEGTSEQAGRLGTSLDSLLWAVSEVAKHAKAAVVVDEFQTVKNPQMTDSGEVIGSFAAASDPSLVRGETAWLYLGSNRHAMGKIFTGQKDSLFQRTHHLPVGVIPERDIIPYLNSRTNREVDAPVGHEAFRWTDGIPGDLQRLYYEMVSGTTDKKRLTMLDLDRAKASVVKELGLSYAGTLQELSKEAPNQLTVLEILANHDIRSLEALSVHLRKVGLEEAKDQKEGEAGPGAKAIDGLCALGLLHKNLDTHALERPEPIFFHYIASLGAREQGGGFVTTDEELKRAFRKLPKPSQPAQSHEHGAARS